MKNYMDPPNHSDDLWVNGSGGKPITDKEFIERFGPGSMDAICIGGWRRITSALEPERSEWLWVGSRVELKDHPGVEWVVMTARCTEGESYYDVVAYEPLLENPRKVRPADFKVVHFEMPPRSARV